MSSEFDSDLNETVVKLNANQIGPIAKVLVNSSSIFESARARFRPYLGGLDWSLAKLESSTSSNPNETLEETVVRVQLEFRGFCDYFKIADHQILTCVSDDFYDGGIECTAFQCSELIDEWLKLPHAIFAFSTDLSLCFQVSFNRSTYYGSAPR